MLENVQVESYAHLFVTYSWWSKTIQAQKHKPADNRLLCVKTNLGILFAVFPFAEHILYTAKGAEQTNRMNYSPSWYYAQNMVYKTVPFFICLSERNKKKKTWKRKSEKKQRIRERWIKCFDTMSQIQPYGIWLSVLSFLPYLSFCRFSIMLPPFSVWCASLYVLIRTIDDKRKLIIRGASSAEMRKRHIRYIGRFDMECQLSLFLHGSCILLYVLYCTYAFSVCLIYIYIGTFYYYASIIFVLCVWVFFPLFTLFISIVRSFGFNYLRFFLFRYCSHFSWIC